MRPRPESVRQSLQRPKIFCEAEAKTYEATGYHATYKYILLSYCISYIIKPTSVRQN